jgi:hypothetical protein
MFSSLVASLAHGNKGIDPRREGAETPPQQVIDNSAAVQQKNKVYCFMYTVAS